MSTTYTSGYTVERLQALEEAIAEGALRVKYSDKEVEYRSLNEMMRIADHMRKKLGICQKSGDDRGITGGKKVVPTHSKGLC